jgi:hypothetical protein
MGSITPVSAVARLVAGIDISLDAQHTWVRDKVTILHRAIVITGHSIGQLCIFTE